MATKKRSKKEFNVTGEIVPEILRKNPGKQYTAVELAQCVIDENPEIIQATKALEGKTEDDAIWHFARAISSQNAKYSDENSPFGITVTTDSPHKYVYFPETEEEETGTQEFAENGKENSREKERKQEEQKLYPILTTYCENIGIKTKRINEKTSKHLGKNYNDKLFADLAGYKDIAQNFASEITKKLMTRYSQDRGCLYSFEVKNGIISRGDVRRYTLQAFSNSSWANYSYLVAEGVTIDAQDELELQCASFKLGVILLNRDTAEGSIVIRAPKKELNWEMINRIASVNPDFQQFLEYVDQEYQRYENPLISEPDWDTGISEIDDDFKE